MKFYDRIFEDLIVDAMPFTWDLKVEHKNGKRELYSAITLIKEIKKYNVNNDILMFSYKTHF